MTTALDFLIAGRFDEAIAVYTAELRSKPDDPGAVSGLARSLTGAGRYAEAIPLLMRDNDRSKSIIPDSPGRQLDLACAYWCLEDRTRAIQLVWNLCSGILNHSVNMAPDQAGGATFGLILHYLSVTAGESAATEYSLQFLRKLNLRYDKRPTLYRYPVQTVKQLLGEVDFEAVISAATKQSTLDNAFAASKVDPVVKVYLAEALFHDGALARARGDEALCSIRMDQVFELGFQAGGTRWCYARKELEERRGDKLDQPAAG